MKPEPYKDVSEPQGIPAATPAACGARIYLPTPQTSHRERDDAYPVVGQLSDTVRVIHCKDGIQWVLQRRRGDQWQGVAFLPEPSRLIRSYEGVGAYHLWPCKLYPTTMTASSTRYSAARSEGRIATKPTSGLPVTCSALRCASAGRAHLRRRESPSHNQRRSRYDPRAWYSLTFPAPPGPPSATSVTALIKGPDYFAIGLYKASHRHFAICNR
jgi:hypothetical protein